MSDRVPASATLLDAICDSMASSLRMPDGFASPAALLWTDTNGQWKPLLPALQKVLPQLYRLGSYVPEERQGPVIWLKCIVDRALSEAPQDRSVVPILYLPNVSRQDLRAGGDCDPMLQPLVELQYRGEVWHQRNGRDWTVEAFLVSEDGLDLDVARDSQTREAMLRALTLLAEEPIAGLKGKRLEAEDFERLAIGDPTRDVLTWMSDPDAFEGRADNDRWKTFCNVCRRQFSLDPDEDGVDAAATALLQGEDKWNDAWKRYCEAPQLYPGVRNALRNAQPKDLLSLVDQSRRPGFNEEQEDNLRTGLEQALDLPHADACDHVNVLDQEHRERRGWVWAQIGESPYAKALEPLGCVARAAQRPLGGASIDELVRDYTTHGWQCDQASLDALSCLTPGLERDLVARVVRTLYQPWLDKSARVFQDLLSAGGVERDALFAGVNAEPEVCVLFVDGLRFDLGAKLHGLLEEQGNKVRLTHRLAPIPTVTATAKPMASPAHDACGGSQDATDFYPSIEGTGNPANAGRLRDAMARTGVEILEKDENRMGLAAERGAWSEIGKIDEFGHKLNVDLVRHIDTELNAIVSRVETLLSAGWRKVRLVTDHGWLLLPGGLPKVEIPASVVESKWARCAVVKGDSASAVPTYPWHWNPMIQIASPPGIGAFRANSEYAHGGVSLQECVVPELIVERGVAAVHATIHSVVWRGMRCRIGVESGTSGLSVDLRRNWKQAESSIAVAKQLDAKGEVSLAVADDGHEGAAATVVVLDGTGRVLDRRPTTVGEDR